jgi:hypothetical protein
MKLYWLLVSAATVGAAINDIVGDLGHLVGKLLAIYWMTHL